jgi:hypothetical protein
MMMGPKDEHTAATQLLDYHADRFQELIERRAWLSLSEAERIGAVYDFVRNEIAFGYNRADDLPASEVLQDGYGQCNTKATLLMALFRAVGIPCRLHGFTIHRSLQRGVVPELVYPIAPENILHSWVEIFYDGRWINLEGFILDDAYLSRLQDAFRGQTNSLCGYGVGTENLRSPGVQWSGESTYIQRTGINRDLGIFDDPDAFYLIHRQELPAWKNALYRYLIRHWMNRRVTRIRDGNLQPVAMRPSAQGVQTIP